MRCPPVRGRCDAAHEGLALGALFVGTVTAINEIRIGLYPLSGQFSDGVTGGFHASDVRSCMGARALAAIGDRSGQRHWHRCATTLVQNQTLSGFDAVWSLLVRMLSRWLRPSASRWRCVSSGHRLECCGAGYC